MNNRIYSEEQMIKLNEQLNDLIDKNKKNKSFGEFPHPKNSLTYKICHQFVAWSKKNLTIR